ncbi:hypothetical protein ONZ45_g10059 [Pleurotus djamor]|nr:hypothetical protein ONZ45_g10059 [Pleurotus djamor]
MSYEQLMKRSRNYLITNRKFEKFCEEALLTYGCRYVWMDSGCINQEDTQEVEDAIRSMYWYYRQAEVCIVYLADAFDRITFSKSSWFTRGWTLQELLAPSRLAFYYGDWKRVSPLRFDIERQDSDTHAQRAKAPVVNWLEASVMKAAGVSKALLCQHYTPSPDQYTTVRNWSKTRDTSRDEDIAYSLVSLLNADNSPPPPLGLDSLRVSLPPPGFYAPGPKTHYQHMLS